MILCRAKLKRCGLFHRKLGLQRLRSMANLPGGILVCEVFMQMQAIGLELERMHSKLYTGICRQVSGYLPIVSFNLFVLISLSKFLPN